jgi:hypothetical protein
MLNVSVVAALSAGLMAQVELLDVFIGTQLFGSAFKYHAATFKHIGVVCQTECRLRILLDDQ